MNLFKSIFARIWALWAILIFLITFFIVLLPSLITNLIADPKGTDYFIRMARLWMRVWFFFTGCRLTVKGTEHFKKGENYIVTCNHNSFLDVPLSCPFIPGPNKTIAKKSFTKIPIFGWYYAKGSVLVDRDSEASRKKSLIDMKKVLSNRMHMSVYPEGTRNRTGEPLKAFYTGAFKLSVDTQKHIIPALIFNTKKALPPDKRFYFLPHKLSIHFLAPINPEGLSAEDLKKKVFDIMKDYFVAHSAEPQK